MNRMMTFTIKKSFAWLELIPEATGLKLAYSPVVDGRPNRSANGAIDVHVPIEGVGGLWATCRAFLYGFEALDESMIIRRPPDGDKLIKLYRDKPRGQHGRLSGEESCWLRIVSGRTEEERRRIKLGPRDLLCLELACNSILALSTSPLASVNGSSPQGTIVEGEEDVFGA